MVLNLQNFCLKSFSQIRIFKICCLIFLYIVFISWGCQAKYHKLGKNKNFLSHSSGGQKCEIKALTGSHFLCNLKGNPSLPLPRFWWLVRNLWCYSAYRYITPILHLYIVFSLYVFTSSLLYAYLTLCPNFPFLKRIPDILDKVPP